MNIINKTKSLLYKYYGLYVKKDPLLLEARRWFKDRGDQTLRLSYPLTEDSIVMDFGAYKGDFAAAIDEKFSCNILLFEPVAEFFVECEKRFVGRSKIKVFKFGLGASDGAIDIDVSADSSSIKRKVAGAKNELVSIRKADSFLDELDVNYIDLIKLNIEGGEYELLNILIESGWINRIGYIQIQFHDFFPGADFERRKIQKNLSASHRMMWNYDFIWESWSDKRKA